MLSVCEHSICKNERNDKATAAQPWPARFLFPQIHHKPCLSDKGREGLQAGIPHINNREISYMILAVARLYAVERCAEFFYIKTVLMRIEISLQIIAEKRKTIRYIIFSNNKGKIDVYLRSLDLFIFSFCLHAEISISFIFLSY